jgi:hypothetical protein
MAVKSGFGWFSAVLGGNKAGFEGIKTRRLITKCKIGFLFLGFGHNKNHLKPF